MSGRGHGAKLTSSQVLTGLTGLTVEAAHRTELGHAGGVGNAREGSKDRGSLLLITTKSVVVGNVWRALRRR